MTLTAKTWWVGWLKTYQDTVTAVVRNRAAQVCGGVLALSLVVLTISGYSALALTGLENIAALLLFALLTAPFFRDTQRDFLQDAPKRHPAVLWAQVSIVALFVILTGLDMFARAGILRSNPFAFPQWSRLMDYSFQLAPPLAGAPSAIVLYVVAPATILLIFGARWAELGVREGHHSWRQAWLWCFGPFAALMLGIALASPAIALQRVLTSALAHGPFEEFLFRGALMTRLARVLGAGWGLIISALSFGVWRLGDTIQAGGGNVWIGLAYAIVSYGVFGLALGLLFQRTRSLFAPSLLHVIGLAAFG
jgi:membrane protease YdiL (CAAX protease family)